MDFEVIKKSKTSLEIKALDKDPTLFNLVVERLNKREDVSFASFRWNHPLLDTPVMYLEVKRGKDASKILEEVVNEILKEISEVEKALK